MPTSSDPRKSTIQRIFDQLSADYDVAHCFAQFGRQLVETAGIEPGHRVLDIATGTGAVLLPAAEHAGSRTLAVGVDLAPSMLRRAGAAADTRKVRIALAVMDAEYLALADAVFDRVFCAFGIMFFPDLPRAMKEFSRVLRPGGKLAVSTWRISQVEDLAAVLRDLGWEVPVEPGWITEGETLAELLRQAGFVDETVYTVTRPLRFASLELYWQNARGTGLRQTLDRLDVAQESEVRAALAARLRPFAGYAGLSVPATALLAVARRDA